MNVIILFLFLPLTLIVNVTQAADVENIIESGSDTDSTVIYGADKEDGPKIRRLSPKDGSEIPEGGLVPEAQSTCYDRVMDLVAVIHSHGESKKCTVFRAEQLYYTIVNDNWHVYTYRADCQYPDHGQTRQLLPSCSAIRENNQWTAYLDKY